MALTVAAKEHWKERIQKRIDRRVETLVAKQDPTLLQRVSEAAREEAYKSLGIDVQQQELDEIDTKRETLDSRERCLKAEQCAAVSPHHWFGDDLPETCLLLSSDDATGKPFRAKFIPAENRDGCFEVCYHVFRKHGLPASFYLDMGSQLKTTRHGGQHVSQRLEQQETQFQRAMRELRVGIIFAHSQPGGLSRPG